MTETSHMRAIDADLGEPLPKPTTVTPGQIERLATLWQSPEGPVSAGVWEASPGTFTAVRDGYHEVCQILAGSATVVGDDGQETELAAGDLFVMPRGWSGTWHVHEQIRKSWVTIDA